VLNNLL